MKNFLINLLTKDLGVKTLALLVAVGLWVFVMSQETKIAYFPGRIPIKIENLPSNLAIVTDIDTVRFKIAAPASKWFELSEESFSATADLKSLGEGVHSVEIKSSILDPTVRILEKDPSNLTVKVEPILEKIIPVEIKIEGMPTEGFGVGSKKESEPTKVTIKAAKSLTEEINAATAIVNVSGAREDIEKNVKVVALDAKLNEIKNIVFIPDLVKVKVPIVSVTNTKQVGIKANIVGEVAKNHWIEKIVVAPPTITIHGDEFSLSKIDYLETKNVDVTGLSGGISQKVKLNLPEGITLSEPETEVEVRVFVKEQTTQRTISLYLNYLNLSPDLKVASATPNLIRVTLSGNLEALENLPANLSVTLDLKGLKAGEIEIPIAKNNISLPAGISIENIEPKTVLLRLE